MIVANATQYTTRCKVLADQKNQLERRQELKRIQTALNEVQQRISPIVASRNLVSDRLATEDRARIDQTLIEIRQRLRASQQRFVAISGAVDLEPARAATDRLQRELDAGWKRYIDSTIDGYTGLLALVRGFPEFATQAKVLDDLVGQIRKRDKAPSGETQLTNVDALLSQISDHARFIEEFPPDVRALLERVVDGTATLADVTDNALHWLRKGDHVQSLAVTFAGGRG
jgi:hypothetical protein